jgi:cytochrome c oxidase subunit 6a
LDLDAPEHTTTPNRAADDRISATMNAQRQFARAAQRFSAQFRAQTQRRFASVETENHFVRERRHVKEHAKATTGEPPPPGLESIEERADMETELWRKISL